jgi:hypothetical protein
MRAARHKASQDLHLDRRFAVWLLAETTGGELLVRLAGRMRRVKAA